MRARRALRAGDAETAREHVVALLRAGEHERAEPLLRTWIELKPNDPQARYLLGFSLLQRYRLAAAEQELRRAVALAPRHHAWREALAKALLDRGAAESAAAELGRAIELAPLPRYRHARALALIAAHRPAEAEAELRACLADEPGHAEALRRLGSLLADRGEDEEARALLEKARALAPGAVETRFRLALLDQAQGRDQEAARGFRSVLELAPGHHGALYGLGRSLAAQGRREEADAVLARFRAASERAERIQSLREKLRLEPAQADLRFELAGLLLDSGDPEAAEVEARAVLALEPGHPRAAGRLAEALEQQGRGAEAAAVRAAGARR